MKIINLALVASLCLVNNTQAIRFVGGTESYANMDQSEGKSTMNSIKESENQVDHRLSVNTNKEKPVLYGSQNNLYADEEEEET